MGYPIVLNLSGKTAVVVGAGAVATRRIRGLLGQGALVRVVAPDVARDVVDLAASEQIDIRVKKFSPEDLDGAFIVHAATSDSAVNHIVADEAADRGLLVCCADEMDYGNFHTPSAFSRGALTISVTTGGESPSLAAVLRERLEGQFGPEYDLWSMLFGRLRPAIQKMETAEVRKQFVCRVLDEPDVAAGILERDIDAAETAARHCIS